MVVLARFELAIQRITRFTGSRLPNSASTRWGFQTFTGFAEYPVFRDIWYTVAAMNKVVDAKGVEPLTFRVRTGSSEPIELRIQKVEQQFRPFPIRGDYFHCIEKSGGVYRDRTGWSSSGSRPS